METHSLKWCQFFCKYDNSIHGFLPDPENSEENIVRRNYDDNYCCASIFFDQMTNAQSILLKTLILSVSCMHHLFVHFYVYSIDRVKHWLKEEITILPRKIAQFSIDKTIVI